MRAGIILPGGTATEQLELAAVAEDHGWDGVFVWEATYGIDAWGLLSAMAVRTSRVMLGTLLTPLPWRRPWKVASQVATLDQLSGGRAIVTVGLGALTDDLPSTGGEPTDLRERADLLDDGIDLMRALWEGRDGYRGAIYDVRFSRRDQIEVTRPVQERVPIWVVALWPRMKSMRRALRCDGVVPQFEGENHEGSPDQVIGMRAWLAEGGRTPFKSSFSSSIEAIASLSALPRFSTVAFHSASLMFMFLCAVFMSLPRYEHGPPDASQI